MFTLSAPYLHTISNTPTLIHTTILVDQNSLVMDVPPSSTATILSQNLVVFPNSSQKAAIAKSSDVLALAWPKSWVFGLASQIYKPSPSRWLWLGPAQLWLR